MAFRNENKSFTTSQGHTYRLVAGYDSKGFYTSCQPNFLPMCDSDIDEVWAEFRRLSNEGIAGDPDLE